MFMDPPVLTLKVQQRGLTWRRWCGGRWWPWGGSPPRGTPRSPRSASSSCCARPAAAGCRGSRYTSRGVNEIIPLIFTIHLHLHFPWRSLWTCIPIASHLMHRCTLSEYCRIYRKIKMTPFNTIHYHPDNSVHKSGPTVTIVGSLDHFNQEMDLGRTGDV